MHSISSKSISCLHPPSIPKKAIVWDWMPLPCRVKPPPGEEKYPSAEAEPLQRLSLSGTHTFIIYLALYLRFLLVSNKDSCKYYKLTLTQKKTIFIIIIINIYLSVCRLFPIFEDLKKSFIWLSKNLETFFSNFIPKSMTRSEAHSRSMHSL